MLKAMSAMIERHLPVWILYLNLYYINAIEKAIAPLLCDGPPGDQYLRQSPDMKCWEGEHTTYGILAIVLLIMCVQNPPCRRRLPPLPSATTPITAP